MWSHRILGAVGGVVLAFGLVGAGIGALGGRSPASVAPAHSALAAPLQQGVNVSGIVTTGTGTCFPDAVLVDCNGTITHQLKGPGGAGFFSPYLNQWVTINGQQQNCTSGDPYIQAVTIQGAQNPCGGGGQPTPPLPPGVTPTATATPPPAPGGTVTPGVPGGDLARGHPVQASSFQPGFEPEKSVDGDPATGWASVAGRHPYYPAQNIQWIYVDLGSPQQMERMRLVWADQRHARSYGIYVWHDSCRGWCYLGSTTYGDGGEDIWTAVGRIEGQHFMVWLQNPYLIGGHYELRDWEIFGPGTPPAQATNVALGKAATAHGQEPGYEPAKATDGDLATEWRGNAGVPTWIYVDLGSNTEIDRAILRWSAGMHATRYTLYAWNDRYPGGRWEAVANRTSGAGGDETVTFWPVSTRYLMVYVTAAASANVGLREFEVFNRNSPGSPAPPGPPSLPRPPFLFEGDPARSNNRLMGRPSVAPQGLTVQPPAVLSRDAQGFGPTAAEGGAIDSLPNPSLGQN